MIIANTFDKDQNSINITTLTNFHYQIDEIYYICK